MLSKLEDPESSAADRQPLRVLSQSIFQLRVLRTPSMSKKQPSMELMAHPSTSPLRRIVPLVLVLHLRVANQRPIRRVSDHHIKPAVFHHLADAGRAERRSASG